MEKQSVWVLISIPFSYEMGLNNRPLWNKFVPFQNVHLKKNQNFLFLNYFQILIKG